MRRTGSGSRSKRQRRRTRSSGKDVDNDSQYAWIAVAAVLGLVVSAVGVVPFLIGTQAGAPRGLDQIVLFVLLGFVGILGNSLGSAVGLLPLYFKCARRVWSAGLRGFALGTLAAEGPILAIGFLNYLGLGLPIEITATLSLSLIVLPAVGGAISITRAQH